MNNLQKTLNRLQKLHPKEIDLSLNRIKLICKKLGYPQKNLKVISVVGTNGKNSVIQIMRSILNEASIKTNIYTSPHLQKINERFVFNSNEIEDNELSKLLIEIENINNKDQITYFEILTAAFLKKAQENKNNLNIVEAGLFHRFDATNIFEKNLASVITAIGMDHTDWLPEDERTIKKIIFEKTSSLLNSKIIVSKQQNEEILSEIKESLINNFSKKIFFKDTYSYSLNENDFFYYEDEFGGLKLPMPNLLGEFQLENIATAIATLRNIEDIRIKEKDISEGIKKVKITGRLQELKSGNLKRIINKNKLIIDGSHNPLGGKVLSKYLESIDNKIHLIIGMMSNKNHQEFLDNFINKVSSITTIDIPNQQSAIKGEELKNKLKGFKNIKYKKSLIEALKSLDLKEDEMVLVTGSLYLVGEVLNLN
ncbi:Mur ligase family protein [Candidatus Pelagibacter sp.]|nr:Mur ligase family protein [Candidatus Pelagibacter sp.]